MGSFPCTFTMIPENSEVVITYPGLRLGQDGPAAVVRVLPAGEVQLLPVQGGISDDPHAPETAIRH